MATLLAFALAAGGATVAPAQTPGEVLLGTFGTRDDPRAPSSRRSQEMDAHRLLEDAREDLSAGYVEAARGRLAQIVRRYPQTTAGREAEAILARIDNADRARAPGGGRADPVESRPPARGRQPPDRRDGSAQQRRAQLEEQLRGTAGDRVFFADGSAELGARARQVLAAQAAWLGRHPDLAVSVEAHADDPGPTEANFAIARQRGEAVRQRLIEEGVAAERIRIVAHGRERRIAPCQDPECGVQNRRVVTTISAPAAAGEGPRTGAGGRR